MYRILTLMLAFCLTTGMLSAQKVEAKKADTKKDEATNGIIGKAFGKDNTDDVPATRSLELEEVDGPQFKFESEVVDYGVIEENADPHRKFVFTNVGNEPIIIKRAKGSCGCTVPKPPKEPIMPGETAEIPVRYATNRIGKFSKKVYIYSNVSEDPIVLTVKGEVKKKPKQAPGVPAKTKSILEK